MIRSFVLIALLVAGAVPSAIGQIEDFVDDPHSDGWPSESFHLKISSRLRMFAKSIEQGKYDQADALCARRFSASLPVREIALFRGAQVSAAKWESGLNDVHSKTAGQFLRHLLVGFTNAKTIHCKFKTIGIRDNKDSITSTVLVTLTGEFAFKRIEQHHRWRMDWTKTNPHSIRQIKVGQIRQTSATSSQGQPVFRDQTATIIGNQASFRHQLAFGQSHWQRRIEFFHGIHNQAQNGMCIGDVNGDHLDDLYVCQPGGLPNRLYLHQADGSVMDVSEQSNTNLLDNSHAALWIDFDNDGDQDLMVSTTFALLMFSNEGQVQFKLRQALDWVRDAYSLAAADFDRDGDVDVFACAYFPNAAQTQTLPVPLPYFAAKNGGHNVLIENRGNWQVADATERTRLAVGNNRFSYAALWFDFDNDGDQDLYVANDFGPDDLFRNDGRQQRIRFTNIRRQVGLEHAAFGMSVTSADFNRDGFEDLYVGNMYSSAGNRVTRQSQFKKDLTDPETRQKFHRLAAGNALLANQNAVRFFNVASAEVAMGRWSWGANFVDLNNDGWDDIVVTNGYITGQSTSDL